MTEAIAILTRRRERFDCIRADALRRHGGKGDIEALVARLHRDLLDDCIKEMRGKL